MDALQIQHTIDQMEQYLKSLNQYSPLYKKFYHHFDELKNHLNEQRDELDDRDLEISKLENTIKHFESRMFDLEREKINERERMNAGLNAQISDLRDALEAAVETIKALEKLSE